ncbi:MAG: hypothetical protein Q8906_11235 [Bacillota bacterium]|nr:hypothetical protein [Bacillota bacterium]MDP4171173.1 hypothetical protein [Bacillota bacterium]
MIKVNIKTAHRVNLKIPVPYALLHAASAILTSEMLSTKLNKLANQHAEQKSNFPFIPLHHTMTKQLVKQTLREMRHHKGLVLVDVKLQDGTQVRVTL